MTRRWVNPGEAWHRARFYDASGDWTKATEKRDELRAAGKVAAHEASMEESRRLGMPNPRRRATPKLKLSNLLLPAAIIGAIIWAAGKA